MHTAIRPTIGAVLGALIAGDAGTLEPGDRRPPSGGVTALASHAVKAGLRLGGQHVPRAGEQHRRQRRRGRRGGGRRRAVGAQPVAGRRRSRRCCWRSASTLVVLLIGRIRAFRRRRRPRAERRPPGRCGPSRTHLGADARAAGSALRSRRGGPEPRGVARQLTGAAAPARGPSPGGRPPGRPSADWRLRCRRDPGPGRATRCSTAAPCARLTVATVVLLCCRGRRRTRLRAGAPARPRRCSSPPAGSALAGRGGRRRAPASRSARTPTPARSGRQLLGVPLARPAGLDDDGLPLPAARPPAGRRRPGGRRSPLLGGARRSPRWDLFLDPQMVAAGHWTWLDPDPALPGVPGVPLTNYAGLAAGRRG